MYINAVVNSVLWHNFHNIIFKIKHKLYTASGSASPSIYHVKIGVCA